MTTRTADREQRQIAGWLRKIEQAIRVVTDALKRCEEDDGDRAHAG